MFEINDSETGTFAICDSCGIEVELPEVVYTDIDLAPPSMLECLNVVSEKHEWSVVHLPGDDWKIYCTTCNKIDVDEIKDKVKDALDAQFTMYSFANMIDDTDLSEPQKQWAKDHLYPTVKEGSW